MPNGYISDAVIFAPSPLGTICIDSKFPLENYEKMTNTNNTKLEREAALKLFKADVKKHIDDIASKIDNILDKEVVKEPAISNKDFWNENISSKIDDPVVVDDLQINKNREEEIEKNLGIDDLNRNTISFNNMFEATQKISVDDILEASKR